MESFQTNNCTKMSSRVELLYSFKDILYRIFETDEVHNSLREDPTFFEEYLRRNSGSIEIERVLEAEEMKADEPLAPEIEAPRPTWTSATTRLLIESYRHRLLQFRSQKFKKVDLWRSVLQSFKEHGHIDFTIGMLDAKMRILKKTFLRIKQNNSRKATGRGAVKWEFYGLMEELFENDSTVNLERAVILGSTISPEPSTSRDPSFITPPPPQPQQTSTSPSPLPSTSSTAPPAHSSQGSSQLKRSLQLTEGEEEPSPRKRMLRKPSRRWQKVEEQRRESLNIEKKRLQALQEIGSALKEANKIEKEKLDAFFTVNTERNDLLKKAIEKLG